MDVHALIDNKNISPQLYILDPLSTIIKLALLNHKPAGTKLRIHENIIFFQEPGIFQGACRFLASSSRSDLSHLYNPIYFACVKYMDKDFIEAHEQMKDLFYNAQCGINKLIDTYKYCNILKQSLFLFHAIIDNFIHKLSGEDTSEIQLFKADNTTCLYTPELSNKFDTIWTDDKINLILGLTDFVHGDFSTSSLETILTQLDKDMHHTIYST